MSFKPRTHAEPASPIDADRAAASPAKERTELEQLVVRLARRNEIRTEAMIQADVRQLFLTAPFDLQEVMLESPAGDRRRIDVEAGATVVEVKRDLRKGNVRAEAVEQLAGYVATREEQTGRRYVGVLTDGAEWHCYHLVHGKLVEVSKYPAGTTRPDPDGLSMWLEGVMATAHEVLPTPREIQLRLGAGSSGHALDRATLAGLYEENRQLPSVRTKRMLWADLLSIALGSQFEDSDELFVEHTLLVNSAEIIAHAMLGLDVASLPPASLLRGSMLDERSIHGAVEADFFDWVIEVPRGDRFVRTLAHRLMRFDWAAVEHDVLKVLYEAVIGTATRKKLGEYYTPDWLAEIMVATTVTDPLVMRVLDPACGSGTFLFHAVRRYMTAAEQQGRTLPEALAGVTQHVIGMDVHPVAVALARVTYLLGLGRERIQHPDRSAIRVPVYLGDSIRWQQHRPRDLLTSGDLIISADDKHERSPAQLRLLPQITTGEGTLRFPKSILDDAALFNRLIRELAQRASSRDPGAPIPSIAGLLEWLHLPEETHEVITRTFKTMCRLHDDGRDHIWGYYVRNLARPLWLSQPANRVHVLLGNPPWLAYRHMPADMQAAFREMSESRKLWHGAAVATHQDLSGLFVVRAIQNYLRDDGSFAFVMPNAVVDRAQFQGFRTGNYPDLLDPVWLRFEPAWDLRRLRPHFFPRGAAVVSGRRTGNENTIVAMPAVVDVWSGRLPRNGSSWADVKGHIERSQMAAVTSSESARSAYRAQFNQGATAVPRMLFVVEKVPPGPLGVAVGKAVIRSARSAEEKAPWKDLPALEGVVETEFLRPLYTGKSLLPYRIRAPFLAVIPWCVRFLMDGASERIDHFPGLARWWRGAEEVWTKYRSSERLTLLEQLDYRRKLTGQFPLQPERVIYTASGMHLTAARLQEQRGIIEHSLYWSKVVNADEALYLCAILNSARVTELVRPLMAYGKDERHFDKHLWRLPIPRFRARDSLHGELATLGGQAEAELATLELDESKHFAAQRRAFREYLEGSTVGRAIDALVTRLLDDSQGSRNEESSPAK